MLGAVEVNAVSRGVVVVLAIWVQLYVCVKARATVRDGPKVRRPDEWILRIQSTGVAGRVDVYPFPPVRGSTTCRRYRDSIIVCRVGAFS
jgi:hypothetical protein